MHSRLPGVSPYPSLIDAGLPVNLFQGECSAISDLLHPVLFSQVHFAVAAPCQGLPKYSSIEPTFSTNSASTNREILRTTITRKRCELVGTICGTESAP